MTNFADAVVSRERSNAFACSPWPHARANGSDCLSFPCRLFAVRDGLGASPHDPPEGVVHAAVVTFNRCYKDGIRTQPSLAGSVRITFAIEESGRVSNAVASQTDLPDPAVVTCLVGAVSALTFPPQSAKVLMTLPLRFQAPE